MEMVCKQSQWPPWCEVNGSATGTAGHGNKHVKLKRLWISGTKNELQATGLTWKPTKKLFSKNSTLNTCNGVGFSRHVVEKGNVIANKYYSFMRHITHLFS